MKLKEVPALFVNHMSITTFPDGSVNMTFGMSPDGSDENVEYHSSVHMPLPVLTNLKEIIEKVLGMMAADQPKPNAS